MKTLPSIQQSLKRKTRQVRTYLSNAPLRLSHLRLAYRFSYEGYSSKPIFLLGPPRSGSTLIYQSIAHSARFAYFHKCMMNYPYAICEYTQRNISPCFVYKSTFSNKYGKTEHINGPSEGFRFWRRFYPRKGSDYVSSFTLTAPEKAESRGTIGFLGHYFSGPFLSKELEMALRLRSLQELFPNAIYVVLLRDPRAIAASILTARVKNTGRRDAWWAMQPSNYVKWTGLPAHLQVANQVTSVYQTIFKDLRSSSNFTYIRYEDFCKGPERAIQNLFQYLSDKGLALTRTGYLPRSFPLKKTLEMCSHELSDIERVFRYYNLEARVPFRL